MAVSLQVNITYTILCVGLVLFAGCMSGLTLGLLSMDIVDLEVLKRSGSAQEQRHANVSRYARLRLSVLTLWHHFDYSDGGCRQQQKRKT